MTLYDVVLAVLLVFPWMLIGVTVVGAAWSAGARRLAPVGKGLMSGARHLGPKRWGGKVSAQDLPAGESCLRRYHNAARRAA